MNFFEICRVYLGHLCPEVAVDDTIIESSEVFEYRSNHIAM